MEKGAVIKHDIKKSPITGHWRYARPVVDKKKCVGCGTCVKYCPEAAIGLETRDSQRDTRKEKNSTKLRATGVATINYHFCKGCGVCARECPVKAIKMKKESASIK
jgi:pyruvate ferredoxin oxidoreductase delta subunit